ncbi:hypothetical protein NMG60_11001544, partial [Bertholletia excelsa]
ASPQRGILRPLHPPCPNYHRPGRSSGCGCCGCILSLILKIVLTFIIIAGLVVLAFWLIFRPQRVKFHVTDASLTQFHLNTTTNNLQYNLALNLTIRNPNKYIGIYYDRLEARGIYVGQRFDSVELPKFYQGHKNTTVLPITMNGQNIVVLENDHVDDYMSDASSGTYSIDVKLYLRVRFKLRDVKTARFKPKIKCDLKVPLESNGTSSSSFETTKCGIDW